MLGLIAVELLLGGGEITGERGEEGAVVGADAAELGRTGRKIGDALVEGGEAVPDGAGGVLAGEGFTGHFELQFGGGGVVIRGGRRGQGLREGGGVEAGKCPGGLGFEGVVFGADAGFGMCFA